MKKIIFTIAAIASTMFAAAQVTPERDPNEEIQDKMQQEPMRPAEIQTERNAKVSAERDQANKKQAATDAQTAAQKAKNEKAKTKAVRRAAPRNGRANPPQ